jgi:hypothetical protein
MDGVDLVQSNRVELQIRAPTELRDPREVREKVRGGGRGTPCLANCSCSDEINDAEFSQDGVS